MLKEIGVESGEELFRAIPEPLRLKRPLNVPPGLRESGATRPPGRWGGGTRGAADPVCSLGGGSYDPFTPAVIDAVAGRSEFYTAYTPYQAEASQGSLQAFFEFQTLICQLTGLDVANASLYEGGSAVAEAVLMALNVASGRHRVLVAESVHPADQQTLRTYVAHVPPP